MLQAHRTQRKILTIWNEFELNVIIMILVLVFFLLLYFDVLWLLQLILNVTRA